LKKEDLGGFENLQTEGIYGKRYMRTLKEELLWLEEFAGLDEACEKLLAGFRL
jgi:hypothetical protein